MADDLITRLKRVILLMTKQFGNLTEKDVLNILKSEEMTGFFKAIEKIENDYEIQDKFFAENREKISEWQNALPGGQINVRKDFVKYYTRMDKFDRAEIQEKVLLHQPQRMKNSLKEFFRLLDASVQANKKLPIEAFAQHLGLTFDELAEQLDRVNWDDTETEVEEEKSDDGELKPPIHIENNFFKYYHQLDKPSKLELQQRITQELPRKVRANLETLFAWLDMSTKAKDNVVFSDLVGQSEMHPQELIRYLDRVNWK